MPNAAQIDTAAGPPRPIGGFFPLEFGPDLAAQRRGRVSVAVRWFGAGPVPQGYRNARSALAYGICAAAAPIRTIWLPSFLCPTMGEAADRAVTEGYAAEVRRYTLNRAGPPSPDLAVLAPQLRPGDAVLAVDYFGRPPAAPFTRYAAARADITWIEDRAQALWPGPAWGNAVLYSARKLLGVPDGGYALMAPGGCVPAPSRQREPGPMPALARFEDVAETRTDWFTSYRAVETAMTVGREPASRLTAALLARIDIAETAAQRRRNHAALVAELPRAALLDPALPASPRWVPQGVPVLVDDAAAAVQAMAAAGVFCPHYWPGLQPGDCGRTNRLIGRVIMLPCDHRYQPGDMARVAAAFRTVQRQ